VHPEAAFVSFFLHVRGAVYIISPLERRGFATILHYPKFPIISVGMARVTYIHPSSR
jgi:hypothetical protein